MSSGHNLGEKAANRVLCILADGPDEVIVDPLLAIHCAQERKCRSHIRVVSCILFTF
jgi:hypothetical protein